MAEHYTRLDSAAPAGERSGLARTTMLRYDIGTVATENDTDLRTITEIRVVNPFE